MTERLDRCSDETISKPAAFSSCATVSALTPWLPSAPRLPGAAVAFGGRKSLTAIRPPGLSARQKLACIDGGSSKW